MLGTGFGWKRVENAARLAVPHVLLLLLLLLGFVSLPLPGMDDARPAFVIMAIYYWSVYRPTLVPPALCFVAGLAMDILSGGALGVNALVLVAVQWVTRSQRRFLMTQSYATIWAVFAALLVIASAVQWTLFGLAHMNWPPVMPAAVSVVLSLFLFPFVTLLFVVVHRILPVASRAFS